MDPCFGPLSSRPNKRPIQPSRPRSSNLLAHPPTVARWNSPDRTSSIPGRASRLRGQKVEGHDWSFPPRSIQAPPRDIQVPPSFWNCHLSSGHPRPTLLRQVPSPLPKGFQSPRIQPRDDFAAIQALPFCRGSRWTRPRSFESNHLHDSLQQNAYRCGRSGHRQRLQGR